MPTQRDPGRATAIRSVEARALRLFDRYAEMDAPGREAGLAALRRDDPGLHEALEALLAADACERPLERAPLAALAAIMQARCEAVEDERIGRRVGAWRIAGIIGEGGMGTIYRVERADGQYQQVAALKYVRAEVSSESLVKAFLEERSVLASLAHPDIVPLFDGGVDAHGQPWFVMPHVEGLPIDRWCNQERLPIRERIALFVRACDSIAYAHGRGILHQDIKPSNLLITRDGRIQLLDFGLSSPIPAAAQGKRLAVTSGYTAPEVLHGGAPGLAVDVYSLGIVLCQLLCDHLPVAVLASATMQAPKAPSALVARMTPQMLAARQVGSAAALGRRLAGELDAIVLRCIQPDPGDRYASVDLLQADLRNWLDGRPVSARGNGLAYRARCFMRRNAYLVAACALAVAGLLAFAGLWAWLHVQVERDQEAASHVDRLLESSIGMATLSGMGDMPLTPAELLRRSEEYLRDASLDGQADARARGLSVLARSWAALGDYDKAAGLADEARQTGSGSALVSAFNMATLAQVQNLQARPAQAEATAREGLASLPVRWSDQHQLAWVRLMSQLAAAQAGQGRSADAYQTLAAAIAAAETLPGPGGEAAVAQLLIQRGTWFRWRHRMAESEADLRRAIALAEQGEPVIADDARESLVRTVRASRAPGREARSLALAGELLESRQHTLGQHNPQTGTAWAELAFIRLLNGDASGAQQAVDEARRILRETVGEAHPAYARTLVAQAFIHSLAGRVDEALDQARRGLDIYRRSQGEVHEFTLEARFLLASLYWTQFSRGGDPARRQEAISLLQTAIGDSVRAHGDVAAVHRMALATLLANSGDGEGARAEIARAREDAARQYGADSQESLHMRLAEISMAIDGVPPPLDVDAALGNLLDDLDRIDTLYARAIAYTAWMERGRWLTAAGRLDEVGECYRRARLAAVDAGQQGWIQKADIKLGELQELRTREPGPGTVAAR